MQSHSFAGMGAGLGLFTCRIWSAVAPWGPDTTFIAAIHGSLVLLVCGQCGLHALCCWCVPEALFYQGCHENIDEQAHFWMFTCPSQMAGNSPCPKTAFVRLCLHADAVQSLSHRSIGARSSGHLCMLAQAELTSHHCFPSLRD